jgi:hypothetical protein
MKTYKATVKVRNIWGVDSLRQVTIQAETYMDAQALIEGQFGFGTICNLTEQ